ncbi:hypothetical protein DAPPUDRAFT_249662 [Daphnia pulex]|uniref:Uncharacterized protein n=1 Tax=Daphnia pulex TaxID=6669 RepID=E9GXG5_DAPPU|nr:hypothetical protein DAPPUDRAFT_249662 [Daphnia pulex]|eukprot:EFX75939.1 hypothetical protein DAPPUDRAFT_249662 [Daphnia pulex]
MGPAVCKVSSQMCDEQLLSNPEYIQQLWVAPSVIYSLVLFVRPDLREMEWSLHSGGSGF